MEQTGKLEVRYNGFDRRLELIQIKSAQRCKFGCCNESSQVRSWKCNVYLCLTGGRNCFQEFYVKWHCSNLNDSTSGSLIFLPFLCPGGLLIVFQITARKRITFSSANNFCSLYPFTLCPKGAQSIWILC